LKSGHSKGIGAGSGGELRAEGTKMANKAEEERKGQPTRVLKSEECRGTGRDLQREKRGIPKEGKT